MRCRRKSSTGQITIPSTLRMLAAMLIASPSFGQTPSPSPGKSEEEKVDRIVVTGTTIPGVEETGSNLISVSRETIKLIGAPTTADLLASVPQLSSFNTAPRASNGGFGSFAPALRNLPSSATLLLMNGRRLVGASAQETNPDYPNIPSLAIQRVEIVADGASALYGSDAISGVVNFITRKHYTGAEASAQIGSGKEYHSVSANGLFGHDWGSGSAIVALQHAGNGNITGGERGYRETDFRSYGGVDTRSTNCPSPNVVIGGISFAAPGFLPNTINYCDNNAPVDLLPRSKLNSAFLSAQHELGPRASIWTDILYSNRQDEIRVAPPAQTLTIRATNPFYVAPQGTSANEATVLYRLDNLFRSDHLVQRDQTKVTNSSGGLDLQLPRDFNLSIYGTFNRATNLAFQPGINTAALAVAAAGVTADTALDPFGGRTNTAVAAAIVNNPTNVTVKQRINAGAAKLDGPVMRLPGGDLKIATGFERRRETFSQQGFVGATPVPETFERDIDSIYAELFVPIVGAKNESTLVHRLSLSLAGRHDNYSDFGSTSNPKVGLTWEPVRGLSLRGTYGRSFRAPGLRQLGATVGAVYLPSSFAAILARDPTRGAAQVDTVYLIGGNKGLQPEKAKTYSLGLDWQPSGVPNLRTSATYYDIRFTDAIGTPSAQLVFADPTLASNITRNPTTSQTAGFLANSVSINLPIPLPQVGNLLDLRLGNFGKRNTTGVDLEVSYSWPTKLGAIQAGIAGNHVLKFDTKVSDGSAASNSLQLGIPRTTIRTTAGMQAGTLSVVGFLNYRSGITNTFNTPTGTSSFKADAYKTVDIRVALKLPPQGPASGAEVALLVNDLFDEKPPFFPATDGIGGTYNPIGRSIALSLRKEF